MIHRINEENEKIKSELSTKILDRFNTVVVSKDFRYCVIDNEGCAGVKVMAVKDDAVRMTRQTADESQGNSTPRTATERSSGR